MLAYGLFLLSGLALGALYSLGGVGLVLLNRATGVLNFAYGAIGAVGAMVAWQILNWGGPEPLAWAASVGTGILLSLAFGKLLAPGLAHREPVVKAGCDPRFRYRAAGSDEPCLVHHAAQHLVDA